MGHICRVITNILETAVGGWIVGSVCVKCGSLEVVATQTAHERIDLSQKKDIYLNLFGEVAC